MDAGAECGLLVKRTALFAITRSGEMNCAVAPQAREIKAGDGSLLACVLDQCQHTGLLGPISSILFGLV